MESVKPGDIMARSDELDSFVKEWDLEMFFERLIDFCKQSSQELNKYEYGSEAVIFCGEYRKLQKRRRDGIISFDDLDRNEGGLVRRAMELKQSVLKEYRRRVPP